MIRVRKIKDTVFDRQTGRHLHVLACGHRVEAGGAKYWDAIARYCPECSADEEEKRQLRVRCDHAAKDAYVATYAALKEGKAEPEMAAFEHLDKHSASCLKNAWVSGVAAARSAYARNTVGWQDA